MTLDRPARDDNIESVQIPSGGSKRKSGLEKGSFGKGVFQKNLFSRDSRE